MPYRPYASRDGFARWRHRDVSVLCLDFSVFGRFGGIDHGGYKWSLKGHFECALAMGTG